MSETVNQENQATTHTGKTFTQDEVNAIVTDRLTRDRAKYADYDTLKEKAEKYDQLEESNKSELQKAVERGDALQVELDKLKGENAVRDLRNRVAEETGVPVHLLTGSTEDECRDQAKAILAYANPSGYPKVRDGGEVTNTGKMTTKQQFAEWASKAFG